MNSVPPIRIRKCNDRSINPKGSYVLYWMVANRRIHWNYSLDRAVQWALELNKPLLILEALRIDYPWASDRLHQFILDGMLHHARHLKGMNASYYPYVERQRREGKGLLEALAGKACVIVTDDYPSFFIPKMISVASRKIPLLMEKVDSNGLLPMNETNRVFQTAYAFRRFLQKQLLPHLLEKPTANPLKESRLRGLRSLPRGLKERWPKTSITELKDGPRLLRSLAIDHSVGTAPVRGGTDEALKAWRTFLEDRLPRYMEHRNQPEQEVTSGLSPYLHFGQISSHQVFHELMEAEDWFFDRLSGKAHGGRSGWWGMSDPAEAFLDQLITWRELSFNMCRRRTDYDQYLSLPDWALTTLSQHERDPRPYEYSFEDFELGRTHDSLWNAAQVQLLTEGGIHNYIRMLWGKKILHWSRTPQRALHTMVELNNKYALDGRDPNSYSGIFWILGRYDRPWGPERPIFGKIRYMSSKNTARKVRVRQYMKKYIL